MKGDVTWQRVDCHRNTTKLHGLSTRPFYAMKPDKQRWCARCTKK